MSEGGGSLSLLSLSSLSRLSSSSRRSSSSHPRCCVPVLVVVVLVVTFDIVVSSILVSSSSRPGQTCELPSWRAVCVGPCLRWICVWFAWYGPWSMMLLLIMRMVQRWCPRARIAPESRQTRRDHLVPVLRRGTDEGPFGPRTKK